MYRSLLIYNSQQKYEPIWLEYLESTGTQWIDTGYKNTDIYKLKVNLVAQCTTTYSSYSFLCGYNGGGQLGTRSSDMKWSVETVTSSISALAKTKIEMYWASSTFYAKLNNSYNLSRTCSGVSSYIRSLTYPLFTARDNSGLYKISQGAKIYSCQMYYDGEIVRDFRPCLHPISLKPAMYDMVEKKYYYNQGTGEFSYNITFETLDYLQSTGTQYIDTGILVGNVNSYKTKASVVTFTDGWNKMVFGTSESEAAKLFGARYTGYWYGAEGVLSYTNDTEIEFNINSSGTFSSGVIGGNTMTFTTPSTLNPTLNINLFGQPNGVGSKRNMSGKIWYFIGSKDGIKVIDMIPVKKTDGTICMYDFISGEYKTNSGTGTFTGYPI